VSTSVVWPGHEGVQIEDRELRLAGPGELKVRVEASGLCGTDLHIASGDEDFAFALPDNLSDNAGALMEPLSVGIWSCRKAGVRAGDHVLVTGAGPIGLLAMQVALAQGAT
jgi:threonine dehydrogenase-like Zn-dependent dehydrogenase